MNPTNLGAIFRSAAALGMEAVLLAPGYHIQHILYIAKPISLPDNKLNFIVCCFNAGIILLHGISWGAYSHHVLPVHSPEGRHIDYRQVTTTTVIFSAALNILASVSHQPFQLHTRN